MSFPIQRFNLKSNIASLTGQLYLNRNEDGIARSIRNLSSGIKIHSGRDNPGLFISSSILRTEISSSKQAIANCSKASSLCSTVDSALGQVSVILNDIRQLTTEAANTGANNATISESLQLQLDACLDSINRIANTTKFLGQNLLDGNLDFRTFGVEDDKIQFLQINQADFQGATEKEVVVKVVENAQPAVLFYQYGALNEKAILEVGGKYGYNVYEFDKDAPVDQIAQAINLMSDSTGVAATVMSEASSGNVYTSSYGKDNDLIITASNPGLDEGNFVVKFVAPEEGNSELSLNVMNGSGNEPTQIEVVLETQEWKSAVYHYNGENDGIPNNEFELKAKIPGSQFNDMQWEFINVQGTGEPTGLSHDLWSTPKKLTISIDYDATDPLNPQNTTVNDLKNWLSDDPILSAYFEIEDRAPSDGSGPLIPTTPFVQSQAGIDGGAVLSNAEQVVNLLNTSPLLQDEKGNGLISASLPSGSTGLGTITPFQQYAYYGTLEQNNQLQFLGPSGSPDIRFVSEPGTPLSVDMESFPPQYGYSTATVQGFDPGTTFSLRSRNPGDQYDAMGVVFQDGPTESAVCDPSKQAVVITVDFSGRESDPDRDAFNMLDMRNLIESSPSVGSLFDFVPLTSIDQDDPARFATSDYLGINAKMGQFSGGLQDPGILVVNLETDVNGNIKTTAADLVDFFENPTSEQSKAVLDQLQISVSLVDPNNGAGGNCTFDTSRLGLGVLEPTFSPICNEEDEIQVPDISFTSSGADTINDYPSADVDSVYGLNSSFRITSLVSGSEYNNTSVKIINDPNGLGVRYNANTKEITISISEQNPPTANEVIALLNGDPSTSGLFLATRVPHSDGNGVVSAGDQARLSGGVKKASNLPSTTVLTQDGIHSTFQVSAKKSDGALENVSVRVVSGSEPSVKFDAVSKQLSIAMDPNHPLTAREVVELINSTPQINELFSANIPERIPGTFLVPEGNGLVRIGDGGILRTPEVETAGGVAMIGNSDQASVGLAIYSTDFGSGAFVSVKAVQGTNFETIDSQGNLRERTTGVDVLATINNLLAIGNGQVAKMNTTDLDVSIWIDPNVQMGEVFGFRITDGGALMQLGPDPNSLSQARISLKDIHTTKLGGVHGFLSELRTGAGKDLLTNPKAAYRIVEDVIEKVAFMRGQIGAFQRDQVERTMNQMEDMLEITTSSQSEIRDTDFAEESSLFTRQQLLLQSGISVLKYPGELSRMILGLLQQ